jgi:UDP-glucose 6-dehydrogenase
LAYKPDTYITEESAGLFLAQQLKRRGMHVLVHDNAAKPSNSPALHEFEVIENTKVLSQSGKIKAAIVCCPWPQYKSVAFHPSIKVISPWKL